MLRIAGFTHILQSPAAAAPKDYIPAPGAPLKKGMAPGMPEHVGASTKVTRRYAAGENIYDLDIHNAHQGDHTPSDIFTADEIDSITEIFDQEKKRSSVAQSTSSPKNTLPSGRRNRKNSQ